MIANEQWQRFLRAQKGDQDIWRELVHTYRPRLNTLALLITGSPAAADDIVQETFIRAATSELKHFTGTVSGYLGTIAYRLAVKEAERGRRNTNPGDIESVDSSARTPLDNILRNEQERQVARAIRNLSRQHRDVLILRFYGDHSYEEIADLLKITGWHREIANVFRRKILPRPTPPERNTGMNHITEDNLLAYVLETKTDETNQSDIEEHLQSCENCRNRLAKIRADIDVITGIGTHTTATNASAPSNRVPVLGSLLRAAAVLIIGIGIGYGAALWTQPEQVTITAQYLSPSPAHDSTFRYAVSDVTGLAQKYYKSQPAR